VETDQSLTGKLIYSARLCRTARADALMKHGLYAGQDNLLTSLAENDGQHLSSLAVRLGVRPPTITKMVTRMEAQGLLRREASSIDNRVSHVFLTEPGRKLLAGIGEARIGVEEKALEGLKEKDFRKLAKILDRIMVNLDRVTPAAED
jgi:DNA-binding MarR family transcriptional regulator